MSKSSLNRIVEDPDPDPSAPAPRVRPEAVLAAAVVAKAVADATSVDSEIRRLYRREAIAFLRGGPALDLWLSILGCDERQVRGLIAKALNGNGRGPKMGDKPSLR